MDNKEELIWVDADFAERWKALKSKKAIREEREKIFDAYCDKVTSQVRDDFKVNLESIEEDAAMFEGLMIKVKKAFEKTKNEYMEASEALWEKFDKEIPSIQKNIDRLTGLVDPLTKQLDTITQKFHTINTYHLKQVVELIQLVSGLTDKNKDILELILKHNNAPSSI
jgi:chromosome segregation ATPase